MRLSPTDPKYLLRKSKQQVIKYYANHYARGRLLDLGCGSASHRQFFSGRVESYTGLDYPVTSQHMGYGASRFDIAGDVRALPLKTSCADAVMLLDVLEHIFEVDEVLADVARILKKGGTLLLTTPFIYPLHGKPYDHYRFTSYSLEKLLGNHQLRVSEHIILGYYGTVLAVLLNQFMYRAVWGREGIHKVLKPLLRLVFVLVNGFGSFLDLITRRQPVWVYLENAVICEKLT